MDKVRFLMSDTSADVTAACREALEQKGVEVTVVEKDGLQVLQKMLVVRPQVVLLDAFMPGLDALAVKQKYVAAGETHTTFFVTGAFQSEEMVQELLDEGFAYYFVKPFDENVLASRVLKVAHGHQKRLITASVDSDELKVTDILHQIGVPAHIKGYQFLRDAILLTMNEPEYINAVTKRLYPEIAKKNGTTASLHLYKAIDPDTWGRMVGRVDGANFAALYGRTAAAGWQSARLPKGMTWERYMHFLLSTLPEPTRRNYLEKLSVSIRFWREKGGCLSEETIAKLQKAGIRIEVGDKSAYRTDKRPVRMEYLDDTDLPEFSQLPTFKRICICILKNDHACKYMGFSPNKSETQRRRKIMEKYESLLRTSDREELPEPCL